MTDSKHHDLRTRIAAVLHSSVSVDYLTWSESLVLAYAVIRELTNPIRGCTDLWHWSTGKPYQCPSCGYWMGEGYV